MLKTAITLFAVSSLSACSSIPEHISLQQQGLIPCPTTPNCISSATEGAWLMASSADWQQILSFLSGLEYTELGIHDADYAHFVVTSRVMHFKDDVELQRSGDGIEYRSASRTGYSDFGVNLKRMQLWKKALVEQKLLQP